MIRYIQSIIIYLKYVICIFISAGPSENYWEVLAERRRIVLEDTLEENKELSDRVEKLEEENRLYKEMLDESRALVEVLQVRINGYPFFL